MIVDLNIFENSDQILWLHSGSKIVQKSFKNNQFNNNRISFLKQMEIRFFGLKVRKFYFAIEKPKNENK